MIQQDNHLGTDFGRIFDLMGYILHSPINVYSQLIRVNSYSKELSVSLCLC